MFKKNGNTITTFLITNRKKEHKKSKRMVKNNSGWIFENTTGLYISMKKYERTLNEAEFINRTSDAFAQWFEPWYGMGSLFVKYETKKNWIKN